MADMPLAEQDWVRSSAATLSSSVDFPVSPVTQPTLLQRFRAGTKRASPVTWHLITVLSLPPAEVNVHIGQSSAAHAAFALRLKARSSGILFFEATMFHCCYGPVNL